jgi:hypothetical protein
MLSVLTIAGESSKSDKARPFKGVDGCVCEIALRHRADAFRVFYTSRGVEFDERRGPTWAERARLKPTGTRRFWEEQLVC